MSDTPAGSLYVVATPIGNLDDLSPRAARVLAEVAVIAAEDTRHSGRLLRHLGLSQPMLSLHEHNEASRVDALDARLVAGEDIALVSDAGTPLISDPGFVLVRALRDRGRRIVPVPGPCALVAALSAAGLPERVVPPTWSPPDTERRCWTKRRFRETSCAPAGFRRVFSGG